MRLPKGSYLKLLGSIAVVQAEDENAVEIKIK
jgi:hypothetical protein